jgi:hypothetical protein
MAGELSPIPNRGSEAEVISGKPSYFYIRLPDMILVANE